MRRPLAFFVLLILVGCGGTTDGGRTEPACYVSYDASYEPATPAPNPSARC